MVDSIDHPHGDHVERIAAATTTTSADVVRVGDLVPPMTCVRT